MIDLNIQIKLIVFSLIFGFLFSIILDIFYILVNKMRMIYSIFLSLIIIIFMTVIYFIGIKQIGYIIFHFYSILAIIVGFISYDLIIKMIANNNKK